jgi:glutathione S-transferase
MIQSIPNPAAPARLITIPVSHYCEKTRWALTRLQVPFVEERHMPPFHRFATRRIGKRLSSEDMPKTEDNLSPINRFVVQQVGGQTVPVLVMEESTLNSSEEILQFVDAIAPNHFKLYPGNPEQRQQVEKLVDLFDSVLAPAVRLWTYFYIMDQPHLVQSLWCDGVPWYERFLFPVVFPWMRSNVVQMYEVNEATAIAAYESIDKIFEMVGELLADGRLYLVVDSNTEHRFSAADLTFATLAAAVVSPVGYGVKLPDLELLPVPMADGIRRFRETVAGQFVLRLYEEHGRMVQGGRG